jgi:polysaccharide pyruvyl transferase WcaK-like protein
LTLVKKAKAAGKKVVMLGQGVGPLTSFFGRRWAAQAFNLADAVAVRDPGSVQTLKDLGVSKTIRVTADMAFLMPPPIIDADTSESFQVGSMTTVGIAARQMGKGLNAAELFGETARMLFQNNYMPVLIEMDQAEDGQLIQDITTRNGGKVPDLRKQGRPQKVQARLARMDAIIAVRLHAGILAATVGVPALMISYDPKVAAFAKLLDLPYLPAEGLTAQRIFETFKETIANRDQIAQRLEVKRAQQVELAKKNIELLDLVLGGERKGAL